MSSIEQEDEGVREILSLMGMDGGEKPQEPQKPAAKTTPAAALQWAVENDLDPEWVTEAVMSDGELYEHYGKLPHLGDRLMAAARHQAVLDALLESRYDDAVVAAGDDPNLLNRVVAEEGDLLDTNEMTAWAVERLQEGESARQEAIGNAYAEAVRERPELQSDPTYASLFGSADWSQVQSGEDAQKAITALTRVGDEVKRREEEADLNAALIRATGQVDADDEDEMGRKVQMPEADLSDLLDSGKLEEIMQGGQPKMGDASDETIDATFAALDNKADEWAAVQREAADRHAEQLAKAAGLERETKGRDYGEEDWA